MSEGREGVGKRLAALIVFAAAMGWLEAVVVVYIRALIGVAPDQGVPDLAEVMRRMQSLPWLLPTEQTREAATIVMLAAVGALAARGVRARIGAFLIVFGVWDLAYYAALRALLDWPRSLGTLDVLFLLPPHPWWHQPVWVPMVISLGFIAVGIKLFRAAPRAAVAPARQV